MAQFLKNTDPRFHLIELRSKAFVALLCVGVFSIIAFAIWKQEWLHKTKAYYVIANTSEGLQSGMSVRTSGFRIGKVRRIELEGPGRVRVDLSVFAEYAKYFRTKSSAKVRGENLIGDRFIEIRLVDDAETSPELPPGSRIAFEKSKTIEALVDELEAKFIPIINGLGSFSETLPKIAGKLDIALGEANGLITDLRSEKGALMSGLDNLNSTINGVKELVTTLRSNDGDLMSGIANLRKASDQLNEKIGPLADELQAGAEALKLTVGQAKELFANANSVVSQLGAVVKEAGPEVPAMVHDGATAVGKAGDVIESVRNMWPIRRGKKDQGDDLLKPSSDP